MSWLNIKPVIFYILVHNALVIARIPHTTIPPDSWTGRWLPERPAVNHNVEPQEIEDIFHNNHKDMGIQNKCDDGKTNLQIDDANLPYERVCFQPRTRYIPDYSLRSVMEYENIPKAYSAQHRCMNESIIYSTSVPTFGPHRQLWPVYGEYKYLPPQRWIHNLEHGGIVALYHPCADLYEIENLKKSVRRCLWRHVITPSAELDDKRPLAVVAWGVRLLMSAVDPEEVRGFIQSHALKGPEKVSRDGQFTRNLLKASTIVSDPRDSQLCPLPLAHD